MSLDSDRRDWLKRVLGIEIGPARDAVAVLLIWQEAKESVDTRLEALAAALRSHQDPDFDYVADHGLFGLTGAGETVGLMAAMTGFDKAASDALPAAVIELRAALNRYRSGFDASPIADLIDDNPFGVAVRLRETINNALRRIEATLA